jgi:hypothetical protein
MDQELTVRPVLCWPPQPRSPTLADAEHGFHCGLVPVGYDHALIAEVLASVKRTVLPKSRCLICRFFCRWVWLFCNDAELEKNQQIIACYA